MPVVLNALSLCIGGCSAENYHEYGGLEVPSPDRCYFDSKLIEAAVEMLIVETMEMSG